MRTIVSLGLNEARIIIREIIDKATSDGGDPVAVAVVNVGGALIAFEMMDGAIPLAGPLAIAKARTAALRELDTKELAERTYPPNPANYPGLDLCFMPGGVVAWGPISTSSGGIGVSGRKGCATVERPDERHDHELAIIGQQKASLRE